MRCSTPVLATLLAWVSGTRDPVQGGGLLLAYTCGYVTPLLVAATVAVSPLGYTSQLVRQLCLLTGR